jgi:hypothetical protein
MKRDKLQQRDSMETKHYSLELRENNTLIGVFRIIFGVACLGVAIFWVIFNIKAMKADSTLWVTVIFLTGFAVYLIRSGLGYGHRYIEIGTGTISFRKNSFLKKAEYSSAEIIKIGFFPLKVVFGLRSGKTDLLRFGVSDIDKVELIKDDLMKFATINNIETELINEM